MATTVVTKSSLNITSGGRFAHTANGTVSEFTTGSNQYAILTITDLSAISASGANVSASVTVGGTTILQAATNSTSVAAVVANGLNGATGAPGGAASGAFPTIYIPPSTNVSTVISIGTGGTLSVAGTYVIFTNT